MLYVTGETPLATELERAAQEAGLCMTPWSPDSSERGTLVLAEGRHRLEARLGECLDWLASRGGQLLWITDRATDDPRVEATRRRGLPYTIVRCPGLCETPSPRAGTWIVVPSDLGSAPFVTLQDAANLAVDLLLDEAVGTGSTLSIPAREGADGWAALRTEVGARAFVLPRWLGRLAQLFGVALLELQEGRARLVQGAELFRGTPALPH